MLTTRKRRKRKRRKKRKGRRKKQRKRRKRREEGRSTRRGERGRIKGNTLKSVFRFQQRQWVIVVLFFLPAHSF